MKKELLQKISEKAQEHENKKELIRSILDNLDQEPVYSVKHLEAISVIEEIKQEMSQIEIEYNELIKQVKS